MRNPVTCLVAAAALCAAALPAAAADLGPVRGTPLGPAATPPPNWYGFYIGLQIGYGWGSDPIRFSGNALLAPAFAAGVIPETLARDPKGVLGGIQWGDNFQYGRLVLGFASDISMGSIHSRQAIVTAVPGFGAVTATGRQDIDWFGTTRVRAGFLLTDNVLLYATGGLASASVDVNVATCAVGLCASGSRNRLRWGWAAGGGLEYAVGRWSLNIEYIHYDLGTTSFSYTDPLVAGPVLTQRTKLSGDIVRAGINYRFNWTPWGVLFGNERMTF